MVAPNNDRRLDSPRLHEFVYTFAETCAFTVAEPAYSCRQALKSHSVAGQANPSAENFVFRKELQNQIVDNSDVAGISGQRRPTERTAAFRKHWSDVGRDETREVVCIPHTA